MNHRLDELEAILFDRHASSVDASAIPLIFILGSPRTGSTLLYQLLINAFNVFYISNLINDGFPSHPAVGAALDLQLNPRDPVPYESHFGKTESCFGPSEASLLLRNWFGGEHPSQTNSATVLPGRRDHMLRTFTAMHAISGKPILIKNAWNCFRIRELSGLFPRSAYIWIRRDLEAASVSDLAARYAHGSPERWNSATTANYLDLQKRPYWEQVVEQQYEYNRAIKNDLHSCADGRFSEVWYEDVCTDHATVIARCKDLCDRTGIEVRSPSRGSLSSCDHAKLVPSRGAALDEADRRRIRTYIEGDGRFNEYRRRQPSG